MSRQLKLGFSAAGRNRTRLSQDDQTSAEPTTFEPPPPKRQKQGELEVIIVAS